MSYLGSPPASQFFAPGTDTFSGDGTTVAFTLSRNVGTVNDILVVVNNVDQQPTAYSVSVSTLTFTAAPSSGTNNIYVRYLSTNLTAIVPQYGSVVPSSLSTPNALYWDTSGNVGVGTTTPIYKLDVIGASRSVVNFGNSYSASYLASALGTANGQLAGISFLPTFVATPGDNIPRRAADIWAGFNGGNWGTQYLAFGVGAAANDVGNPTPERMRIDGNGTLFLGQTTNPSTGSMVVKIPTATGNGINLQANAVGTSYALAFYNSASALAGYINFSGTTTSYVSVSDYRLKENVLPMVGALDKVAQLKPCTYKWKSDGSDGQGFIAHELQAVVPDCVSGIKDAVDEDGNIKPQGIDTSFLVATLTAAIQEQQAMIEELKTKVAALEAR